MRKYIRKGDRMALNKQIEEEIWADIKGYEGYYKISTYGNVMSLNYNHTGKSKLMQPTIDKDGYERIGFSVNGKKKYFYIHRLVAIAFIKNPNNLPKINHKDMSPDLKNNIPVNNHVENLEWCTNQYNNTYGDRIEKAKQTKKEKNSYGAGKTVYQYDLNGNLIKIWNSVMDIQRTLGFGESGIRGCCYGRLKKCYGFIWKYREVS